MTTSISGTGGVTFPDASVQASSQVGMKNRIIDGGFTINQRGYTSGTSLASGTYGHDRWKGGASAGTYTFTQGALGVNTTITITAGSIIQVIEGCNLPEGGTYVLSWTGTAQGRLNGGTYGSSGTVTVTGWTAGTNLNVEFNTGTLGSVQLEKGSTATSFDYRPYGTELALCQRYCPAWSLNGSYTSLAGGLSPGTTGIYTILPYPVTPRVPATGITATGTYVGITASYGVGGTGTLAISTYGNSENIGLQLSGSSGLTTGAASFIACVSTGTVIATGCEL